MIISGIQQIGIGVSSVKEAWRWYRDNFGMDVRVFEEAAPANYMLPYTGGEPRNRHAALAVNMMGGGGFEIWQYTERIPEAPKFEIQLGDLGIFAGKMKAPDIQKAYLHFEKIGATLGEISENPTGRKEFFIKDPYNNIFQIVESDSYYKLDKKKLTGASYGAIIGATDMEKSIAFYSDILGYDKVVYDETKVWEGMDTIPGGKNTLRRVLLQHSEARQGFFSKLFGPTEIELVQSIDREGVNIFKDRFWGDLGFIHLCYDITGMSEMKSLCKAKGHPFTVDSTLATKDKAFDMGEAAGHFSYIEDPDGTLIEFVETHKVPIVKSIGWYLNLGKRKDKTKPVADYFLSLMGMMKVKDKHLE